jgi:hypothetical protein
VITRIGHAIASGYYWCLWFFGASDTDGNFQTIFDRDAFTYWLRRGKERQGHIWWVIAPIPWLACLVWTVVIWPSWFNFLSVFFFGLFWWLFAHVLAVYSPPDKIWGGKQ